MVNPSTQTSERLLRNRLGIALVVAYFAHTIASVAYAATVADPKGQAVWLAAPIMFTPAWLLELLPTVSGPKSYSTWYLQTLVHYPAGIAFACIVLYLVGALLQSIWGISLWLGVSIGTVLGVLFGALWFVVTGGDSYSWFVLGVAGALASFLVHPKRAHRLQT